MARMHFLALALVMLAMGPLLASCEANETSRTDEAVGMNGGFEIAEDGYPVNWAFFPNPETNDIMEIVLDTTDVVEGASSLKLTSKHEDQTIGIRSRRVPVETGKQYRVSAWVKTDGADLTVHRTTMDASGKTNNRSEEIGTALAPSDQWQEIEETLVVAEDEAKVFLRFFVNGSGTVWIDDVMVEETPG